jgi:hypothetical protein
MAIQRLTSPLERRVLHDRRVRPASGWRVLRLCGRRRGFRRAGEGYHEFVDCPTPYVVGLVLWITMGSALDALCTLVHVSNGGGEANPFMAHALTYGSATFVWLKMGITCLGTWVHSILQQFPLAVVVLHILTLVYVGIMGLHAVLLLP